MEQYRIGPDAVVYFVTFSAVEWLPVFIDEGACRIITDSLAYCHRMKGLRTNAFVVMPTHFHAIVFDAQFQPEALRNTLADFRKYTGRRLSDRVIRHLPKCFADVLRQSATGDRKRRFWQPTQHPVAITSEGFWRQKIDYLHENPCRKGLVRRAIEWRFSSAAHWMTEGREPSDAPLTPIPW